MNVRDSYHHGDLRQAILEAACEHLRDQTADSLSLRALARVIGVSQTAPYRHFDSRNALFAGIACWGFTILEQKLHGAISGSRGETIEDMLALGRAYLDFSREHYEKYRLCYDSSLVEYNEYPELRQTSARTFELLISVIKRGIDAGEFVNRPVDHLAAVVWAGLHGMASLLQVDHSADEPDTAAPGKAVAFLAASDDEAMMLLLQSIRRQE